MARHRGDGGTQEESESLGGGFWWLEHFITIRRNRQPRTAAVVQIPERSPPDLEDLLACEPTRVPGSARIGPQDGSHVAVHPTGGRHTPGLAPAEANRVLPLHRTPDDVVIARLVDALHRLDHPPRAVGVRGIVALAPLQRRVPEAIELFATEGDEPADVVR